MPTRQETRVEQRTFVPSVQLSGDRFGSLHSRGRTGLGPAVAIFDILIILGSGVLAYYLRPYLLEPIVVDVERLSHLPFLGFLLCYAILAILCNTAGNLYAEDTLHTGRIPKLIVFKSFLLASVLTVTVVALVDEKGTLRQLFAGTLLFSLMGIIGLRYAVERYNRARIKRGVGTQHVLIVGAGQIGQALRHYLDEQKYLGKIFCGFIDNTHRSAADCLGTSDDLPRLLKEHFIDEIYFTPEASRDLIRDVALQARQERINVKIVPDLYGLASGVEVMHIGNIPILELNRQPIPIFGLLIKRLIDVSLATILAILTIPIMAVAALATKLDSPGPVLYAAWRVGRKGRKFRCYKFRTMIPHADSIKIKLRSLNERNGATFKLANDPRITRVGRFLRKYSIDELPQLLNVLRGDMSMVGPRPHPVDDYEQYGLQDLRRLNVLPGITGLWQIRARHDPSFETNVLLDLEYIETWNVWLDIKILLKTIPEICRGSGH